MSEGFKVTLPRPTAASRARARALLRRADRPCLFDRVEHAVTILHVPHKTGVQCARHCDGSRRRLDAGARDRCAAPGVLS